MKPRGLPRGMSHFGSREIVFSLPIFPSELHGQGVRRPLELPQLLSFSRGGFVLVPEGDVWQEAILTIYLPAQFLLDGFQQVHIEFISTEAVDIRHEGVLFVAHYPDLGALTFDGFRPLANLPDGLEDRLAVVGCVDAIRDVEDGHV